MWVLHGIIEEEGRLFGGKLRKGEKFVRSCIGWNVFRKWVNKGERSKENYKGLKICPFFPFLFSLLNLKS